MKINCSICDANLELFNGHSLCKCNKYEIWVGFYEKLDFVKNKSHLISYIPMVEEFRIFLNETKYLFVLDTDIIEMKVSKKTDRDFTDTRSPYYEDVVIYYSLRKFYDSGHDKHFKNMAKFVENILLLK